MSRVGCLGVLDAGRGEVGFPEPAEAYVGMITEEPGKWSSSRGEC